MAYVKGQHSLLCSTCRCRQTTHCLCFYRTVTPKHLTPVWWLMQCTDGGIERGGGGQIRGLMLSPAWNLPKDFLDSWLGGKFHSPAWKKLPLQSAENFSKLGKEKKLAWVMYKIVRYQQWVLPVSGMKDSKEILEFYYHFYSVLVRSEWIMQTQNWSLCTQRKLVPHTLFPQLYHGTNDGAMLFRQWPVCPRTKGLGQSIRWWAHRSTPRLCTSWTIYPLVDSSYVTDVSRPRWTLVPTDALSMGRIVQRMHPQGMHCPFFGDIFSRGHFITSSMMIWGSFSDNKPSSLSLSPVRGWILFDKVQL